MLPQWKYDELGFLLWGEHRPGCGYDPEEHYTLILYMHAANYHLSYCAVISEHDHRYSSVPFFWTWAG